MDELEKDYSGYQAIDFLADENFIRYVKFPEPLSQVYWDRVAAAWPEKQPLMQDAREMMYLLERPVMQYNEAARRKIWQQVEAGIAAPPRISFLRRYRFRLAAAVLLLLIATGVYQYLTGTVVYETGYADSRQITLPDHSQVTLNAHSRLSYARNWRWSGKREVFLEGEGFFDVKHLGDTFRLYVKDVSVTVLGTAFNVKDRRDKTVVVLQRGRIRINVKNNPAAGIILSPGEGWEYNRLQAVAVTHKTDTTAAAAWTRHQLVLEGTTLREVIQLLEDNYGYHVILEDSSLANRKLTGSIPMQKKEDLFFVLSKIFNIDIIQQPDTLLFRARP
ncbi:FecR family protein [Chitinophaga arvensicola]|uniref:Ferric-dicitrate binding protein FerR, regulates iron transport through sigma-19 n=1 Tax=Chitinophaga arvensicola TaxID=29529 RepID=A0A1I0SB83_9BACT|nr:FecR domain-containing protein [Chitinophaga arvensicola]SEW53990.1 ferric-dicitrate binding protein FerR, regulates iron transport through sigma-19 [Chitinophaga arvensicola]